MPFSRFDLPSAHFSRYPVAGCSPSAQNFTVGKNWFLLISCKNVSFCLNLSSIYCCVVEFIVQLCLATLKFIHWKKIPVDNLSLEKNSFGIFSLEIIAVDILSLGKNS